MNFNHVQAASRTAGSSEVEVNIAALPPAGRPIGAPSRPGNGPVTSSKSPWLRSTAPKADVDQNIMPTSPAEKDDKAAFHSRFCISHSVKMSRICSRATSASGLSIVTRPPSTIALSWLHNRACTNQLPVMFQPQKMGLSMPLAFMVLQAAITSSHVVGSSSMPPSRKMSML